jgi:hypothetical protein
VTEANVEDEDLFALFLAALEAVVPEVTSEKRALVRDVVDGMIRERVEVPPP